MHQLHYIWIWSKTRFSLHLCVKVVNVCVVFEFSITRLYHRIIALLSSCYVASTTFFTPWTVTQINLISLFSWIHCFPFECWRKPPNKNKYSATDASPTAKLSTSTTQLILLRFHFVFTIQVITRFPLPSTLSHLECLNVLYVVIFYTQCYQFSFHVEQRICWFLIFLSFLFSFCLCFNCIIPLICHSSFESSLLFIVKFSRRKQFHSPLSSTTIHCPIYSSKFSFSINKLSYRPPFSFSLSLSFCAMFTSYCLNVGGFQYLIMCIELRAININHLSQFSSFHNPNHNIILMISLKMNF